MTRLALLAAALLSLTARAAEPAVLLPTTATNIDDAETLAASQEFLIGHLQRTGRFAVARASVEEPEDREWSAKEALAAAKQGAAKYAVTLHLSRLGNTTRARLTAYEVGPDKQVFSDDMPAAGLNDLDKVLERLAASFAKGRASDPSLGTVTQRETDSLLKKRSNVSFGVRIGGLGAFNRPSTMKVGGAAGGGLFLFFDSRRFLADLSFDFASGGSNYSTNFGIGAYYPFSDEDITPYLGGGLSLSWSSFGGRGANGLRVHAATGLLLGRISSTTLRGELGYFVNTFGEEELIGTRTSFPHGPMLSLGIIF